jgi:hypothetical protein
MPLSRRHSCHIAGTSPSHHFRRSDRPLRRGCQPLEFASTGRTGYATMAAMTSDGTSVSGGWLD